MAPRPNPPPALANLSSAQHKVLSMVLAEHRGDTTAAAKALGIARGDLRQLIAAKPKLLRQAHEVMSLEVIHLQAPVIRAFDSPKWTKRAWAADMLQCMGWGGDGLFARPRGGVRGRLDPVVSRLTEARQAKLGFVPQPSDIEHDAAAERAADAADVRVDQDERQEIPVNRKIEAPPLLLAPPLRVPPVHQTWRPVAEVFDGDPRLGGQIRRPTKRNPYNS